MPTYIYAWGIIALTAVSAWAQDVMLPKCASLHQARLEAVHLTASMSEAIEKRGPHVVCNLARKYLAALAALVQSLESDGPACGVTTGLTQHRLIRDAASRYVKVCDASGDLLDRPKGDFWKPGELNRLLGRP